MGWADNSIDSVRVWPSPDKTRVVFDLSDTPDYSYFTLYQQKPYRLVIDFNNTSLKAGLANLGEESLLVDKIRTSSPKNVNSTRIVIELDSKSDANLLPCRLMNPIKIGWWLIYPVNPKS